MKILAIIPVRSGSKRIPNKNVRPFANKSLNIITCEQVMRLRKLFADIILTTDSDEAIKQGKQCGIPIIRRRPDYLCADSSLSEDAIDDAISWVKKKYDFVYLSEVTSPLRSDSDIISCLDLAKIYGRGVKSVCKIKNCLDGPVISDRLQLNGAIHLWDINHIRDTPYDRFSLYEMDASRSIHIDYSWEFDVAELLYRRVNGI